MGWFIHFFISLFIVVFRCYCLHILWGICAIQFINSVSFDFSILLCCLTSLILSLCPSLVTITKIKWHAHPSQTCHTLIYQSIYPILSKTNTHISNKQTDWILRKSTQSNTSIRLGIRKSRRSRTWTSRLTHRCFTQRNHFHIRCYRIQ